MICYAQGVMVQSDQYEFALPNLVHPEHLFICGSTYLDSLIPLNDFMRDENVYQQIRNKQI